MSLSCLVVLLYLSFSKFVRPSSLCRHTLWHKYQYGNVFSLAYRDVEMPFSDVAANTAFEAMRGTMWGVILCVFCFCALYFSMFHIQEGLLLAFLYQLSLFVDVSHCSKRWRTVRILVYFLKKLLYRSNTPPKILLCIFNESTTRSDAQDLRLLYLRLLRFDALYSRQKSCYPFLLLPPCSFSSASFYLLFSSCNTVRTAPGATPDQSHGDLWCHDFKESESSFFIPCVSSCQDAF